MHHCLVLIILTELVGISSEYLTFAYGVSVVYLVQFHSIVFLVTFHVKEIDNTAILVILHRYKLFLLFFTFGLGGVFYLVVLIMYLVDIGHLVRALDLRLQPLTPQHDLHPEPIRAHLPFHLLLLRQKSIVRVQSDFFHLRTLQGLPN